MDIPNDVVGRLIATIQRQERHAAKLSRKLGRMAYWRNRHRTERDNAVEELNGVMAAKHGLARQLGKEQKRVLELEATVAELQASLNAKLAEEVSHVA